MDDGDKLDIASSESSEESEESMNMYLNDEVEFIKPSVSEDSSEEPTDDFSGFNFSNNYGYGSTAVKFEYPKLNPVDLNETVSWDIDIEPVDDLYPRLGLERREREYYNSDSLFRYNKSDDNDDNEEEEVSRRSNHSLGRYRNVGYFNTNNRSTNSHSSNSHITSSFSFNKNNNYYSESSLSSPSTPEPISGKLSREEGGMVGLRNLGNTCYLNSTLQCLTATGELSYKLAEDFENGSLVGKCEKGKMFLNAIGRLFHEMWQSGGKITSINRIVEPRQFKNVLGFIDSRFSGYRQEDSQEALAIILDRLHEDLKRSSEDTEVVGIDQWEKYCEKENSIVRKLFHGQLKSIVKCRNCSFKSETFDPFSFLNLPIPLEPVNECGRDIYYGDGDGNNSNVYGSNNANVYGINTSNISTTTLSTLSTISNSSATKIRVLCYNDRVYNRESAYLIINRHFGGLNEFRSFFRGFSYWLIEFEPAKLPLSVRTKLPESRTTSRSSTFIAYKADLLQNNYLISFEAERTGIIVGFPVMIRRPLSESLELLSPAVFIKTFMNGSIRPILSHRFPDRLEEFDSTVSLMLASPNEYFKIEIIGVEFDLIKVKVVILDDKSDFNETIFFRDVDDPNDLFEELVYESDISEDEDDAEDGEIAMDDSAMDGITIGTNVKLESKMYPNVVDYPYNSESTVSSSSHRFIPSLKDCFNRLCSRENLDWKCEKCCETVQAEKCLQLWRLPDILVLHLKRFSYGGSIGTSPSYFMTSASNGAKIGRAVDFSLEIDLKDLMGDSSPEKSTKFQLFAISQHFGSLHFGHYTAILKHQNSSKWFCADDTSIKVFDDQTGWFNDNVKEAAYVLFYRRIE